MKAAHSQKEFKNNGPFVEKEATKPNAGRVVTWTLQRDKAIESKSVDPAIERELKEGEHPFFTEKATKDMQEGKIPNLEPLYHMLGDLNEISGHQLSAINFLPALRAFNLLDDDELARFIQNPETNHVIAQNDRIKIVLIRWEPGAECKIHGHAIGGCVLKVLQGKVLEKRFSADAEQKLLSENTYFAGSIAYIDDLIGLHNVANQSSEPAITLHLYTPGNYKPKKYVKSSH